LKKISDTRSNFRIKADLDQIWLFSLEKNSGLRGYIKSYFFARRNSVTRPHVNEFDLPLSFTTNQKMYD